MTTCPFCKCEFTKEADAEGREVIHCATTGRGIDNYIEPEYITVAGHFLRERLVPLRVATDVALMKLSDAKPGDVLVIRGENLSDARALADQLGRICLPKGSLPDGKLFILTCRSDVEWSVGQLDLVIHQQRHDDFVVGCEYCLARKCPDP